VEEEQTHDEENGRPVHAPRGRRTAGILTNHYPNSLTFRDNIVADHLSRTFIIFSDGGEAPTAPANLP
jgi:hypothetical protein